MRKKEKSKRSFMEQFMPIVKPDFIILNLLD